MRSLSLDRLRALDEVLTRGSFSAAARALALSQPAVSLQIRELETRFGVKLVERVGRRTYATAAGEKLLEHARAIEERVGIALDDMARFKGDWIGRVRLGTTLTTLMYALPPVLKQLRHEHAGIELHVFNLPTQDSIAAVLANRIDLALVTLPVDNAELRVVQLRREFLVALMPADTPNIPKVVTPAFAAAQTLVMEHDRGAVFRLVMRWLAGHLPLANAPMEMGTIEGAKRGVACGLGMTFVPDVAAEDLPDIVRRPLRPMVECPVGLIEHAKKASDEAHTIVRNALMCLRQPRVTFRR